MKKGLLTLACVFTIFVASGKWSYADLVLRYDARNLVQGTTGGSLSSTPKYGNQTWRSIRKAGTGAVWDRGAIYLNSGTATNDRIVSSGPTTTRGTGRYVWIWCGRVYTPLLNGYLWSRSTSAGIVQQGVSFSSVSGAVANNLTYSHRWSSTFGSWRKSVSNLAMTCDGRVVCVAVIYRAIAGAGLGIPNIIVDKGDGTGPAEYAGYTTGTASSGTEANTSPSYLNLGGLYGGTATYTRCAPLVFEWHDTTMSVAQVKQIMREKMAQFKTF